MDTPPPPPSRAPSRLASTSSLARNSNCCSQICTFTLLAISVIGTVCGVLIYLSLSGQIAPINAFSSIPIASSYLMIGGGALLFILSSIALASIANKS
ncbi:MAG: hypothetical protein S4CHLAM45_13110 [Chlamydiales bacterium]|nr:hypothetical protein [Chlamydiales bacterium]MCH9619800.1 hypothetical protein [Chlamydiales bacterium]MCH9623406.1 hypothetical protein [Chlamydiales bacterium]